MHEGADRTNVDDVALEGMVQIASGKRVDHVAISALSDDEGLVARHLAHEANAPRTDDAPVREIEDVVRDAIPPLHQLLLVQAASELLRFEGVVLQHALSRRVADRAVQGMVDEKELDHGFARVFSLLAGRMNDHSLLDRHRA